MSENTKQDFPFFSFLALMTLGCVHVFCPHGRIESLSISFFNLPKGKHMLKRAESHRCEVNTLGTLACKFCTFLRFLKGIHFRKSLTESETSGRF